MGRQTVIECKGEARQVFILFSTVLVSVSWSRRLTEHIEFYSDLEDPMVPTVRLEGTVEPRIKHFPNIFGCNKTFAILQRYDFEQKHSGKILIINYSLLC